MKTVAAESLVLEAVYIDKNDIHMEMALTEQVMSIVHPVYCLVILVFEDECSLILCRKYFQRL